MSSQQARTGPRRTLWLHIGVPKSGTTYVQARHEANYERGLAGGLLWAGRAWPRQVDAVREVCQLEPGAHPSEDGPWAALVADVQAHPDADALISMEWLCQLTPEQVDVVVDSFPDHEVHVVLTLRDLQRNLVAQWQEGTRNLHAWDWATFLDNSHDVDPESELPAARVFWRQQHVPAILDRWTTQVPYERLHVVTVPPAGSDPGLLWERWCEVLGLDAAAFEEAGGANSSTGVVSSVLMAELSGRWREAGHSGEAYKRILHTMVARNFLPDRRADEGGVGVDADTAAWVSEVAAEHLADLRGRNLDVVGDLADLEPRPPSHGRDPRDVTDRELLDLCEDVVVRIASRTDEQAQEMIGRKRETEARLRAARRQLQRTRRELQRTREELQRTQGELTRTRTALERSRAEVGRLREQARHLREVQRRLSYRLEQRVRNAVTDEQPVRRVGRAVVRRLPWGRRD